MKYIGDGIVTQSKMFFMVLYNMYVFCVDWKFKMAKVFIFFIWIYISKMADKVLKIDSTGKIFEKNSSLKPINHLKAKAELFLVWFSTKCVFWC